MKTGKLVLGSVIGLGLLASGIVIAQTTPVENIDPHRHPNLADAQHHIRVAYDAIGRAQSANDWDLQGHAAHAKELLDQAAHELKASAEASNAHQ
jgi:hypothetical protein